MTPYPSPLLTPTEGTYKSSALGIILFLLVPVTVFMFIRDLAYHSPGAWYFFILQNLAVGGSFYFLHQKDYPKASFTMVYGVALTRTLDLVFLGYVGVNTFYLVSISSSLLLMAGTFFLTSFRHMALLSGGLWLYFIHHIVSAAVTGKLDTSTLTMDQQVSVPLLGFLVVTVLALGIRRVFDKIIRDQTETLIECAAQHRGLGQLIRGIAHRLNTPLGNAKMLLSSGSPLEGQAREILVNAMASTTDLINRLRSFINCSDFATIIPGILEDQITLILAKLDRPVLVERRPAYLQVATQVSQNYWDSIHLVLEEVLKNAVNHAQEGEPKVTLDIEPGDRVVVTVFTPGTAYSPEALSKMTLPFFSSLNHPEHPGLGLYFADHILRYVLGGELKLSSPGGGGLEVRMEFPRKKN